MEQRETTHTQRTTNLLQMGLLGHVPSGWDLLLVGGETLCARDLGHGLKGGGGDRETKGADQGRADGLAGAGQTIEAGGAS